MYLAQDLAWQNKIKITITIYKQKYMYTILTVEKGNIYNLYSMIWLEPAM